MNKFESMAVGSLWLLLVAGQVAADPVQVPLIPTEQIDQFRQEHKPFFLDVRSAQEISELGTLPGYYNIPLEELPHRIDELPKDRPILTA